MRAVLVTVLLASSPVQQAPPPPVPPSLDGLPAAEVVTYQRPVDAPVVDGFRPPDTPYGAGNRGLELATAGGESVVSAAPGQVTFAGLVAGERYVVVLHADRLRTTYGRLATIEVAVGDQLAAGQQVGTAGPSLIWTARLGEAYVDPALLLAASGARRAWLVP